MLRIGLVVIALVFALQCQASAQGFLDSIFGPSGLGLWGDSFSGQFNSPEPYATGNQMPGQMPYQGYSQAPGYQQQYYPNQQGYAPQQYAPQQQAPQQYAPQGQSYYQSEGQVGAAPQQQYSPPQQYAAPQQYGGQQYAPQQQAPVQQFTPQQQAAPTGGQRASRPQRTPAASGLRPGQYSPTPQPGAPGQLPISADDLPPGAVSISTTTPEGTRVEYYPPAGEQGPPQSVRQRPRQQKQGTPSAGQPRRIQPRQQMTSESGTENPAAPIAMPKPVEIPGGQDPRSGWGAAVNQGPARQGSR